jgi:hypothetical protein
MIPSNREVPGGADAGSISFAVIRKPVNMATNKAALRRPEHLIGQDSKLLL